MNKITIENAHGEISIDKSLINVMVADILDYFAELSPKPASQDSLRNAIKLVLNRSKIHTSNVSKAIAQAHEIETSVAIICSIHGHLISKPDTFIWDMEGFGLSMIDINQSVWVPMTNQDIGITLLPKKQ